MALDLFIFGLNHQTAPVEIRERLAFAEDEIVPALSNLKRSAPSVAEAALVSTCNRVEFVAVSADSARAQEELRDFLATQRRIEAGAFENALYRLEGREAVRHLFRVGASLDSMVVGEPQILGQLKLAYAHAAGAGTVGMILHRAFHRAFAVAKRVRKNTLLGHGAVSVSSAAVSLAREIFDTLKDKTVMLLGAGQMAELTARQLVRLGVQSLLITNRTFDRAVALAREIGGTAVTFDNYKPYLKIADVLIGSVATTRPLLGPEDIEPILRERMYRPMFLIDLGVPRNFHERLSAIENVYLYDIDDLGGVVTNSRAEREREAQKAEVLVEEEVESFWRWLNGLELVPTIKDIRSNIERLTETELKRHRAWLAALPPAERGQVELLTRGIANKILHQVTTEIRRANGFVNGVYAAEVARRLLGTDIAHEQAADDDSEFADDEAESGGSGRR
jgi:glutamyl-tRNA reductase